ncbi:MAG: PspC domain-containing protein [Candidatus Marinimicrobia bacterium]|nr:PspC domain-containing protein [Candidatus Neomarinimicrobiota bacterium]
MKKTNTINLGGIIFHIDEDAFIQLQNYLNTIRDHFSISDGQNEIVNDIESRIAEIMQEKKIGIITKTEVDDVIAIMGKPEEYGLDDTEDDFNEPSIIKNKTKRIFRHPDEKIIGGVCGGLGVYFNVDPVLFRLGFLLTLFLGGFGFFVYLVLWIAVPEADSTTDRLKMEGKPITANAIGKAISEQVEKGLEPGHGKNVLKTVFSFLGVIFNFLFDILKNIFTILGKIIKPLIGVLLLGFGLVAAIALSFFIVITSGLGFGSEFQEMTYTLESFFSHFPLPQIFIFLGIILFIGIPLFQIIYLGLRLMFNTAKQSNTVKGSLLSLWIVGLLFMIFFGFRSAALFSESARKEIDYTLHQVLSDTLNLKLAPHDYFYWNERDTKIIESENGEYRLASNIRLNIRRSRDTLFHLYVKKRAHANSYYDAKDYAENISYNFHENQSSLSFDQFFKVPADYPYQQQEVKLTLLVPTDKSIYLGEQLKYFIYDIRNVHRMHDRDMIGNTWKMTRKGLTCLSCNNVDTSWNLEIDVDIDDENEQLKDLEIKLKSLQKSGLDEKRQLLEEFKINQELDLLQKSFAKKKSAERLIRLETIERKN